MKVRTNVGVVSRLVERTTAAASIGNPFDTHAVPELAVRFCSDAELDDLADTFVTADLVGRCGIREC